VSDATGPSGLDRILPPEIRRDRFSPAIEAVGATEGVRHILEIGASGGDGSTEAWIRGALRNLDDVRSFKNWENYHRLREVPAFCLVKKSRWLRNGFAVFERTG